MFCIGEQEKKIIELEKRLNMNNIDNMPREKIKLYKCFPNSVKFDYIHGDNNDNNNNNNTNRKSSNNSRKKIIGSKSQNSYQELGIIPKNYSLDEKNNIKLNKTQNNEIEHKNQTLTVIKNYEDLNNDKTLKIFCKKQEKQ